MSHLSEHLNRRDCPTCNAYVNHLADLILMCPECRGLGHDDNPGNPRRCNNCNGTGQR